MLCILVVDFTHYVHKFVSEFQQYIILRGDFGMQLWPGMSAMDTSISSIASMVNFTIISSKAAVGEDKSYPSLTYFRCLALLAQVRPSIYPSCLSFIKFTASKAFLFASIVNISGSVGVNTGFFGMTPSFSCFSSFKSAAITFSHACVCLVWQSFELILHAWPQL